MILDLFWRVSYKKPILIISDQFIKTGLKEKRPDHSPFQSFCGLFAVPGLDFQEIQNRNNMFIVHTCGSGTLHALGSYKNKLESVKII